MPDKKSILIIEDDRSIRQNLVMLFELEGFEVSSAANGREALDALATASHPPSLALLDLMMPVMSGEEFVQELRKDPRPGFAQTPLIVISAARNAAKTATSMGLHLMAKPIRLNELLEEVDRAMGA